MDRWRGGAYNERWWAGLLMGAELPWSGLASSGLGLEEGSWVWFRKEGTELC